MDIKVRSQDGFLPSLMFSKSRHEAVAKDASPNFRVMPLVNLHGIAIA